MTREVVEAGLEEQSPAVIPPSGIWGTTFSRYDKIWDITVQYDGSDRVTAVFHKGERIVPRE